MENVVTVSRPNEGYGQFPRARHGHNRQSFGKGRRRFKGRFIPVDQRIRTKTVAKEMRKGEVSFHIAHLFYDWCERHDRLDIFEAIKVEAKQRADGFLELLVAGNERRASEKAQRQREARNEYHRRK